ncbi:hypothetical protein Lesp01_30440 [Lentzea sp. NBRC 102530]|nr:hypothetical protein Lesp01_30440 [Lentzea sp. NBRC 102530]
MTAGWWGKVDRGGANPLEPAGAGHSAGVRPTRAKADGMGVHGSWSEAVGATRYRGDEMVTVTPACRCAPDPTTGRSLVHTSGNGA